MADPDPKVLEFLKTLPEELRADPSLQNIADVPTLAKNYVETKRAFGMDRIAIPKDPKDPEWSNVWGKLGRPGKPEEYEWPKIQLPEGFSLNPEGVKAFAAKAHELGLSKAQAGALYEFYAGTQAKAFEQMVKQSNEEAANTEKALRETWGKDYDTKMQRINRIVAALGGEKDDVEALAQAYGTNPKMIKFLGTIADRMSDDSIGDGKPKPGLTKDEIHAELATLRRLDGPWGKKDDPAHGQVMKRIEELEAALQAA